MGVMFLNRYRALLFFIFYIGFNVSSVIAQANSDAEHLEELGNMRMVVLLLIAFAFVIMFGLIYVVKSHRELKHQYTIIEKQKHQISEKNEQLAFNNDSLQEMNVEKNNVISVVAHDLKTPLGNIQGLVELVYLNKEKLTKEQIEYLALISKVVTDGISMVNNMLDVHKIEAELKEMVLVYTNVYEVIEKVTKLHTPSALAKQIKINVDHSNQELDIKTDAQYLRQIISNLVSNAIKYSAEDGTVDIRVAEKEKTLQIFISDSGKGIDNDQMRRLFAGYKTAGKSVNEKASPGFSLLITRRLVDKLKGKITVENKATGSGAVLTVELLKS